MTITNVDRISQTEILIYDYDGASTIAIIKVTPEHARWLEALTALEYAPTPQSGGVDIEIVRASALNTVSQVLTDARKRFITDLPGQDMIYLRKEQEAKAFLLANPTPSDLTPYPFIANEVGVTAPTAYGVAQVFSGLAAAWLYVGSELEGIRILYKNTIIVAADEPSITKALNNMNAEILTLLNSL